MRPSSHAQIARVFFAFWLPAVASAQTTITWNFGVGAGSLAASGGVPADNLTVSSVSSFTGQTLTNANASGSSGYAGASGAFNASFAAVTGAFNASTSSAFTVTLTPASGYELTLNSIAFGSRSTTSGPTTLAARTSADTFAANVFSSASPTDGIWNLYNSGALTSVTGTSAAPLTVRIYGSGGTTASAGNWRLDDLQMTMSLTAIPEPSTYALFGGIAALGGAWWQRRRRRIASNRP